MKIQLLKHDGRCKWLEQKILKGLYLDILKHSRNPRAKRHYIIIDWISNDGGRVGVDLMWFKTLGLSAVRRVTDLPATRDYVVINSGYDSIVHEEQALLANGVEILDAPCPFIRRLRRQLETADAGYQYILLCEANHIVIKNFALLFPPDMILVQMANYRERILAAANGKPFMLLPYVTFLPRHVAEIMAFLTSAFPDQDHQTIDTHCMWIKSKASPIVEIEHLANNQLQHLDSALLITGAASANKSLMSLCETLEGRGLAVTTISRFRDYVKYEAAHRDARVLLVRSPIPNTTEALIMAYLKFGYAGALLAAVTNNRWLRAGVIGAMNKTLYLANWLKIQATFNHG
jgi:4-hydroxy-3-methylbut-2-enyl diphosphate reductase IspH